MSVACSRTRAQPAASQAAYPLRDERVKAIEQAIQALPTKNYASSGDFARIQEEVRPALPPAPRPLKPPTLQR